MRNAADGGAKDHHHDPQKAWIDFAANRPPRIDPSEHLRHYQSHRHEHGNPTPAAKKPSHSAPMNTTRASATSVNSLKPSSVRTPPRARLETPGERGLREARVIIVAAGMEGALFSVVAGLVAAPVIALPTSVGYAVAAGGAATVACRSMLTGS